MFTSPSLDVACDDTQLEHWLKVALINKNLNSNPLFQHSGSEEECTKSNFRVQQSSTCRVRFHDTKIATVHIITECVPELNEPTIRIEENGKSCFTERREDHVREESAKQRPISLLFSDFTKNLQTVFEQGTEDVFNFINRP
jgi:hypothetical protein